MARRSKIENATGVGCALLVLAWSGLAWTGCGDDDHGDHDDDEHSHEAPVGVPSEATCPEDSDLDYEGFGKPFMEDYCTRCHSSELSGAGARHGAPLGHDFDSLAGIQAVRAHIDQKAAAGPEQVNEEMPPGDPKPSLEARKLLGEWLACGAPE